ncbi:hypothetical protein SAMN05444280_103179 [Tangfeifania diversioriginum]|uniref:Lipoprotein n=1 Tax=Tangfeifania diversioriginum TaxID=1168035 RepID=A0A1M6C9G3_9BACT|nr:hypothetical protein [Tangfeifania diversioriginum]SHI57404.1 hypothetical protein SAMN05444280_103179 [Tangfeifania diversioriginum]
MKNIAIYFLIILIFQGCNYSESNSRKNSNQVINNTDDLINKNKNKILFLNFWSGINENEFESIKDLETKNGNLKNGDFILMLPEGNSSFKEVPFAVIRKDKSILLQYNDDHWVNRKDIDILETEDYVWGSQAKTQGRFYEEIENYLINTFDEKYERIEHESNVWKTKINDENYKTITLEVKYWYYANNAKTREPYGEHIFANGGKLRFEPDDRKKRDKVASGEFQIIYEMLDTYLDRERLREKNAEQYKQEKIKQENETKDKINENKSKL